MTFSHHFQTENIDGEIEATDDGFVANERFVLDGELIDRETDVKFNDDGSVTIVQQDQITELVTLSEPVVERLCIEAEAQK